VFGLSRGQSKLVHERYQHICADVTAEDTIQRAFARIANAGSLVDVLIYSAAIASPNYALLTPHTLASQMLSTNLLGAFLVTRHAARLMKRNGFGRMIYLSSIVVPLGSPGQVVYSASKAGLEQMAYTLSREFPQDNITFNSLGISFYASSMLHGLSERALSEARALLSKPNILQLQEIVGAIDFLASDTARNITGQTLYFGGVR